MRALSLILFLCLSLTSHAVVVSDLYEVQVQVADQSSTLRAQALQEALQQVLVKVAGTTAVMQDSTIQEQNSTPDRFVRSYRYTTTAQGLMLDVVFAQDLIDRQLRQIHQPIWGKSRPLILLWQGVEEKRQRQLLNQESQPWQALIEQAMNERGIPLLWPNLDMEDQMALPVSTAWGLFADNIGQASARYLTDAYMAGRLSKQTNGNWLYQGFLFHRNQRTDLTATNSDSQALLRNIADQVASTLSAYYAVISNGDSQSQRIEITNINNFKQYQQLLAYFRTNTAIKQTQVVKAEHNILTLDLELTSDWGSVWGALVLDKRLETTDQDLFYRWHD